MWDSRQTATPARYETSRKKYSRQAMKAQRTTAPSKARPSAAPEPLFSSERVSRSGSRQRGRISAHPAPGPEPAAERALGRSATEDAEPIARTPCIRRLGPQAQVQ